MLVLFGVAAAITGFSGICLLFFRATRKTYPGFGYWTTGVFIIALGYLLYALREQIPLWSSVFLGTGAFPLGMVLHLDGIRRFLGLRPASKFWYAVPLAVLCGMAVFYFHWDSSVWRGLVASIPITAIHWTMAALLFGTAVSGRETFYQVIGSLLGMAGLLILARAIWLVFAPSSDVHWKAPLEFAFYISFIVLHLGENFSLIMLNAERVEQELAERAQELNCLYGISELLEHENVSLDESLQGIVNLIPPAWQYPEITCAKIILDDREFTTENYAEPVTKQSAHIIVHGGISGALEVGYLERRPDIDGGPFLKEERLLIKAIAERLGRIIERIRSEEALRKQKEFTETALDSQRDTFFVFEPATGRAISWNQAFRGITRYTDEEIAGMRAPDSYYGPEDLERARICMQDVLEKGRCTIELELICKDGQRIPTEYEASLVKDVAGVPRYVIAVGRDIRERKKAERDREAIIAKLEQALAEVKRLSGFLPICASCKKIRDDKGYWQQIERYITDHSEALFSHSICPDCARKLYPDLFTDDSTRHPGDPK